MRSSASREFFSCLYAWFPINLSWQRKCRIMKQKKNTWSYPLFHSTWSRQYLQVGNDRIMVHIRHTFALPGARTKYLHAVGLCKKLVHPAVGFSSGPGVQDDFAKMSGNIVKILIFRSTCYWQFNILKHYPMSRESRLRLSKDCGNPWYESNLMKVWRCTDFMRLCFHIGIQTQDISKKSTPQYIVSGRFGTIMRIGHGQIYKISALQ